MTSNVDPAIRGAFLVAEAQLALAAVIEDGHMPRLSPGLFHEVTQTIRVLCEQDHHWTSPSGLKWSMRDLPFGSQMVRALRVLLDTQALCQAPTQAPIVSIRVRTQNVLGVRTGSRQRSRASARKGLQAPKQVLPEGHKNKKGGHHA